jgi:hypothetical protein
MSPNGEGATSRLKAEILGLAATPLDDTVNEGPHARVKRIAEHGRRSGWPWVAASTRIEQSLSDISDFLPLYDEEPLQSLWVRWSSILRPESDRFLSRPLRLPRKVVEARIYRMTHWLESDFRPAAEGDQGDGDDPGDPGDGPPPARRPIDGGAGRRDGDAGGGQGSEGDHHGAATVSAEDAGGGDARPGLASKVRRTPDEAALMRQYLAVSLKLHSYVSFPLADQGDRGQKRGFYQILGVEERALVVETFDLAEKVRGLFELTVQPLEVWSSSMLSDDYADDQHAAEVFVVDEPLVIDALALCPSDSQSRRDWLQWVPEPSDIEGCLTMTKPEPIRPTLSLASATIPVLCLTDALEVAGWSGVSHVVQHVAGSAKEYDKRALPRKRRYLQCCLVLQMLLDAGVVGFSSLHNAAWYDLLLRTKKLPPDLSSEECKRRLSLLDGNDDDVAGALQVVPGPPAAKKARTALQDDDIVGDDLPPPLPDVSSGPLVPLPPASSASASAAASSTVANDDVSGSGVAASSSSSSRYPSHIFGCSISFVKSVHRGQWSYEDRLAVTCPRHAGCTKSRSTALDVDKFGVRAPSIFLGAWIRAATEMNVKDHKGFRPSIAQMRAFQESHGDQLDA